MRPQRSRPFDASAATYAMEGAGALPPAESAKRCRLARAIASAVLDVPLTEIERPTRSPASTCHARHIAMYLAHVIFQVPLTAISHDFGRDRTSVAHGVRRVEDRRDDEAFDALLSRLETLAAVFRGTMEGMGAAEDMDAEPRR